VPLLFELGIAVRWKEYSSFEHRSIAKYFNVLESGARPLSTQLMAFKHRDGTVRKLVCGHVGRMLDASPRFISQTRSAHARSR